MKLLSALFLILAEFLRIMRENKVKEEGRQQVKDILDENVKRADDATPDPVRDQRLRERFGRRPPGSG
jgi:hypothetical protein